MLLLHLAALQCTCHPPKRQDHSPERKKETTYPIPRTNTPPHSQVKEAASRSKYLPALKYAQGSLLKNRESSSTMEEEKKLKKKNHSLHHQRTRHTPKEALPRFRCCPYSSQPLNGIREGWSLALPHSTAKLPPAVLAGLHPAPGAGSTKTGGQGNAQAKARAKRTWKEMPRMTAQTIRQGTPKLNADMNVATQSQGVIRPREWGKEHKNRRTRECNSENSARPETSKTQNKEDRQPSGHHEAQFRALGEPYCAGLWNG